MPQYVRSHTPGGTFFFMVSLLERKGRPCGTPCRGRRITLR